MSNTSKTILAVFLAFILIIGIVTVLNKKSSDTTIALQNLQNQQAAVATSIIPVDNNPQSTGQLFSQYKYFTKANEIFPVMASTTKNALGAFNYKKTDLGNNTYKFTLINNAEGYKGQSVIASAGDSVYFIEPYMKDDSSAEDSVTTDDILLIVDASGYVLK